MIANKRKYKLTVMHPRSQERFWRLVDKREPDECWPWKGPVHVRRDHHAGGKQKGDGLCFIKGAGVSTDPQRIAYEATGAKLDTSLTIKNTCGNKHCCNPGHLYPYGTDSKGVEHNKVS